MADIPEATATPVRYVVSCLPEGHADRDLFTVQVEYRAGGLWAVKHRSQSLGSDGTWSWGFDWSGGPDEPATSDEMDTFNKEQEQWLAEHRFDYDTALQKAKDAAATLSYRGYDVAQALSEAGNGRPG